MNKPRQKKILPPPELQAREVPLSDEQVAIEDSRRGDIHATTIRWRDLVLATWQLGDDKKYRGRLPEGLSSQQFWAKVTRAAGRLAAMRHVHTKACYSRVPETEGKGMYLSCGKTLESPGEYAGMKVGVAVRGREWWVWSVRKPGAKDLETE